MGDIQNALATFEHMMGYKYKFVISYKKTAYFNVFIMTKSKYEKSKGEIMISQEEVREKLIKRAEREKQTYIAKQIGVPKQLISEFKLICCAT